VIGERTSGHHGDEEKLKRRRRRRRRGAENVQQPIALEERARMESRSLWSEEHMHLLLLVVVVLVGRGAVSCWCRVGP
jgi:hypothetical protein